LRLNFFWFREENFVFVGPTFITFRIDAISPTADPSMDDGASSLSARNGVLHGFVIDEHFGMGFSGTWHGLTSWHPEVVPQGTASLHQRIRSVRQIERWGSEIPL
jgi:hypothetical protein